MGSLIGIDSILLTDGAVLTLSQSGSTAGNISSVYQFDQIELSTGSRLIFSGTPSLNANRIVAKHNAIISGATVGINANTFEVLNVAVVRADSLGSPGTTAASANGQGTGGGKYSLAIVGGGGMYLLF